MTSWSPGSHIESYEVLNLLGRGGMGAVYQVRHLITNRIEALKVIASGPDSSGERTERFNREIRLLASLAHPNIAGLHTAFHHDDQLVMVMEYVPGTDLGVCLKSGITLEESLTFGRQILRALDYAHSQGVIHRDIKPSNVMVTSSKQIKLLDFGLALGGLETRLTAAGSLVGSMHYVSPELISGEPADTRSDLYAVGVTLYEMITGRLPIEGTSPAQIIANHLQHQPTAPARLNANIPEALSAAVMKALKKDKDQRWQSASVLLSALDSMQLGSAAEILVTSTEQHTLSPGKPTESPVGRSAANRTPVQLEVLSDIADRLANHVGPIAKILVRRASSNAHDVRELCEMVAKEIESEEKRKQFMQSVQGHIRANLP